MQNDPFKGCKQVKEIDENSKKILEDYGIAGIVTTYGFLRHYHQRCMGLCTIIGKDKQWMDQVDLIFFFTPILAVRGIATYKTKKNP